MNAHLNLTLGFQHNHPCGCEASVPRKAFTLIELLVVIAVIGVLALLLTPGLARTQPDSRTAQCLSNKRQIQMACAMYAGDNHDIIPPNAPVGTKAGWCNGAMYVNWSTAIGNTNRAGYATNGLAPYVGGQIKVYKCPGDTIPSDNGDRIRSIAMNGQMGDLYGGAGGGSGYNPGWRVYVRFSDLTAPVPAKAWIFADESMYTLNDGFLQMNLNMPDYPDILAAYHGGINCLTFGDGHVEAHRWKWKGIPAGYSILNCPYASHVTGTHWGSSPQDVDWLWLQARSAARL